MSSNQSVATATTTSSSTTSSSSVRFPKRLYVPVSPCATRGQLAHVFGQYGKINSLTIPTDEQGRSKGIAFVRFQWHEQAAAAMEGLNGKVLDQMILRPQWATPSKRKDGHRHQRGSGANKRKKNATKGGG